MRRILGNSELIILFLIVILSTYLVGGISFDYGANFSLDPSTITSSTIISPTPGPSPTPAFGVQVQSIPVALSAGAGLHGAFIAETPDQVALAAAHGMSYIINYHFSAIGTGDPSNNALDINSALGKAYQQYNMKSFLDLHQFISYSDTTCALDESGAKAYITAHYQSPNLGGYWIKDDDVCLRNADGDCISHCDMKPALKTIAQDIRAIDSDTSHVIMEGFGEPSGLQLNYDYGVADMLAFYPYPSYDGGVDAVANTLIPEMARYVQVDHLPAGKTPPPFIGIYQAFWSNQSGGGYHGVHEQSIDGILKTVQAFMDNGALGLNAFSIGHPGDVNRTAAYDQDMAATVDAVNNWLVANRSKYQKLTITPTPTPTSAPVAPVSNAL